MSGAGYGGLGWGDNHQGVIAAWIIKRRHLRQIREATEADLIERGILPPVKPASPASVIWAGFALGLILGLFLGLIFWELT